MQPLAMTNLVPRSFCLEDVAMLTRFLVIHGYTKLYQVSCSMCLTDKCFGNNYFEIHDKECRVISLSKLPNRLVMADFIYTLASIL